MRHVIIHYHIYKNAGVTVDAILRNNFGEQWGTIEAARRRDIMSPASILLFSLDNPQLKSISSHQARLPVPVHPNVVFHPIVFLRHPIDRVGSVYSYESRQPPDKHIPAREKAHAHDFAGFVRWGLEESHNVAIQNFQTVHLAGREDDMRTAAAIDSDLREARQQLFKLPFFGIVEFFDKSIARMGDYLLRDFGRLNMDYVPANQTPGRKETLQERIDDIRDALGPELYRKLLDKNALDMRLYDYAVSLFQSRNAD